MEKKLRKHRNTLVVAGSGVLLFGVWSVARFLMFLTMTPEILAEIRQAGIAEDISPRVLTAIIAVMVGGVLAWELALRLYVGLSARAVGHGKKKSMLYLLVAAGLACSQLAMTADVQAMSKQPLITLMLDLTSLYAMADVIYAGLRVQWLCRKKPE